MHAKKIRPREFISLCNASRSGLLYYPNSMVPKNAVR